MPHHIRSEYVYRSYSRVVIVGDPCRPSCHRQFDALPGNDLQQCANREQAETNSLHSHTLRRTPSQVTSCRHFDRIVIHTAAPLNLAESWRNTPASIFVSVQTRWLPRFASLVLSAVIVQDKACIVLYYEEMTTTVRHRKSPKVTAKIECESRWRR